MIDLVTASYDFYHQAALLREALAVAQKKAPEAQAALKDFDQKALKIQGTENGGRGNRGGGKPAPTFALLNRSLGSLASTVDEADVAPTPAMQTAYTEYCRDLTNTVKSWNELLQHDLPTVNEALAKQRLAALPSTPLAAPASCSN